jgi:hypothetical protein
MMIRYLYAACAAAVLMLPVAGTSYAGSAHSTSFVATFGYGDVDYKYGNVKEETAITGGLSYSDARARTWGDPDPNNAASATTSGGFSSTATANGTSDTSSGATSLSGNHNNNGGCGCDGATSHSEGGTSASASAGAGAN